MLSNNRLISAHTSLLTLHWKPQEFGVGSLGVNPVEYGLGHPSFFIFLTVFFIPSGTTTHRLGEEEKQRMTSQLRGDTLPEWILLFYHYFTLTLGCVLWYRKPFYTMLLMLSGVKSREKKSQKVSECEMNLVLARHPIKGRGCWELDPGWGVILQSPFSPYSILSAFSLVCVFP